MKKVNGEYVLSKTDIKRTCAHTRALVRIPAQWQRPRQMTDIWKHGFTLPPAHSIISNV